MVVSGVSGVFSATVILLSSSVWDVLVVETTSESELVEAKKIMIPQLNIIVVVAAIMIVFCTLVSELILAITFDRILKILYHFTVEMCYNLVKIVIVMGVKYAKSDKIR